MWLEGETRYADWLHLLLFVSSTWAAISGNLFILNLLKTDSVDVTAFRTFLWINTYRNWLYKKVRLFQINWEKTVPMSHFNKVGGIACNFF